MIERLLPPSACVVEEFGDRDDIALSDEERAVIAGAVAERRREFTTVRACARDALTRLGVAPTPLVPGRGGAPVWPAGVVGSMTHCSGYRGAVVDRQVNLRSIGIDAEPDAPLPAGVLELIAVPRDLPALQVVASTGIAADRLLFSAKEAVFKAWYPLARQWLGFDEVSVLLYSNGTFVAEVITDKTLADGSRLEGLRGNWLTEGGLLLTATIVG